MTRLAFRAIAAAAFALVVLALGGCPNQAASPVGASPASHPPSGAPAEPEPECKGDSDCKNGEICKEEIRAACPTCDGGTVVHVCRHS